MALLSSWGLGLIQPRLLKTKDLQGAQDGGVLGHIGVWIIGFACMALVRRCYCYIKKIPTPD